LIHDSPFERNYRVGDDGDESASFKSGEVGFFDCFLSRRSGTILNPAIFSKRFMVLAPHCRELFD